MESGGEDSEIEVVKELLEEFSTSVLRELESEVDEARSYLKFLAWLNRRLEEKGVGRIIITGGFAVEIYTGRVYRTMDVDVVVEGAGAARIVEEFLKRIGEKIGRGYLPYAEVISAKSIDIVSTAYDREMKPVKLVVGDRHVYVEPPEELLIRYLAAWELRGSTEDKDKAVWLYYTWRNRMGLGYVADKVRRAGVEDKLSELQQLVETSF